MAAEKPTFDAPPPVSETTGTVENERTETPGLFTPFPEDDGATSVLFPSAIWPEHGYVGVMKRTFDTPEEAARAAVEVQRQCADSYDMYAFENAYMS
jgi:hypothetical protein